MTVKIIRPGGPNHTWEADMDGYRAVVEPPVNGIRKLTITNPGGDVVDEGDCPNLREAFWALRTAVEAGE